MEMNPPIGQFTCDADKVCKKDMACLGDDVVVDVLGPQGLDTQGLDGLKDECLRVRLLNCCMFQVSAASSGCVGSFEWKQTIPAYVK